MINTIEELTDIELMQYWNEMYELNKVDYCIYINSSSSLIDCKVGIESLITSIEKYSYYVNDKYFYFTQDNLLRSFSRFMIIDVQKIIDYINAK